MQSVKIPLILARGGDHTEKRVWLSGLLIQLLRDLFRLFVATFAHEANGPFSPILAHLRSGRDCAHWLEVDLGSAHPLEANRHLRNRLPAVLGLCLQAAEYELLGYRRH